jgi:Zn-dependent metalloprotease
MSDFMTASTNYHGARTAALNAAAALYGSASPELNAVAAAYAAINVQ